MWSGLIRLIVAVLAFVGAMAVTRFGPVIVGRTERAALEVGAWGLALMLAVGAAWYISARWRQAHHRP